MWELQSDGEYEDDEDNNETKKKNNEEDEEDNEEKDNNNDKSVKYYTLLESQAQVGLESDDDNSINKEDMEGEEEDNKKDNDNKNRRIMSRTRRTMTMKKSIKYYTLLEAQAQVDLESSAVNSVPILGIGP